MQFIYEVHKNEEYFAQDSQGLYSSLDIARANFPEYSEILMTRYDENQDVDMQILVKPQFIESVRKEYPKHGYWWYRIKGDMGYDACIIIFRREVCDTIPNSGDNENDIPNEI